MKSSDIESILAQHAAGKLSASDATKAIKNLSYEDLGYARVDHARTERQGFPEVIFGEGKTTSQIVGIFEKLNAHSNNLLITRTNEEVFAEIRNIATDAEWHPTARIIRVIKDNADLGVAKISVVTAGTSDIPVAEEAALTAEAMGNSVTRIWDAGVAGIHRILVGARSS